MLLRSQRRPLRLIDARTGASSIYHACGMRADAHHELEDMIVGLGSPNSAKTLAKLFRIADMARKMTTLMRT